MVQSGLLGEAHCYLDDGESDAEEELWTLSLPCIGKLLSGFVLSDNYHAISFPRTQIKKKKQAFVSHWSEDEYDYSLRSFETIVIRQWTDINYA